MFRGLALVFCMTLLAVSTRVMFAETQAARLIRQADASAIPLGPLAAPVRAWSHSSFRGMAGACLDACLDALTPDWRSLLPEPARQNLMRRCGQVQSQGHSGWPGDGVAHLLGAALAAADGQPKVMTEALTKAQTLARHEGWQAERRFVLLASEFSAEPNGATSASIAGLMVGDIDTMLATQSGAELMAAYYIRRPALRVFIKLALGKASAADRTRLLNLIRIGGAA